MSNIKIQSIDCELSNNMKTLVEFKEYYDKQFSKYLTKSLIIPKEMFGKQTHITR